MKYEPTRPGNPNRLTIRQHVFPRTAIDRFASSDGFVSVQRLDTASTFRAKSAADIFCAMRVWGQATETTRSSGIEIPYAALADEIVAGAVTKLTDAESYVVSRFYALWNVRHHAKRSPMSSVTSVGVVPEPLMSQESEENLEANGYAFLRGATLPGRMTTGISMMVRMAQFLAAMRGARWGIVRSKSAQFLVPDNVVGIRVVPVSPTICLCQDTRDCWLGADQVGLINRLFLAGTDSYYFGCNLDRCPILRRTLPLALPGSEGASETWHSALTMRL